MTKTPEQYLAEAKEKPYTPLTVDESNDFNKTIEHCLKIILGHRGVESRQIQINELSKTIGAMLFKEKQSALLALQAQAEDYESQLKTKDGLLKAANEVATSERVKHQDAIIKLKAELEKVNEKIIILRDRLEFAERDK